jgi:hypothetical protein
MTYDMVLRLFVQKRLFLYVNSHWQLENWAVDKSTG